MTNERITRADVQRRIELVKVAAARLGWTTISYGGATYDSLTLFGAYGTWALHATPVGTSGSTEIGSQRGLRAIADLLDGMYWALDSARHNSDVRTLNGSA